MATRSLFIYMMMISSKHITTGLVSQMLVDHESKILPTANTSFQWILFIEALRNMAIESDERYINIKLRQSRREALNAFERGQVIEIFRYNEDAAKRIIIYANTRSEHDQLSP